MSENKIIDVLIIGAGPAGMTAAIYASRAGAKTAFIEKDAPGGKMVTTSVIENYTGFENISGPDLSLKMFNQTMSHDVEYIYGDVKQIINKKGFEVVLQDGKTIKAKRVIVATGMREKVPPIDKVEDFFNHGVSFCAICDGPLFKGKEMAIIGGGESAVKEANYLSAIAKKVHIFIRKDYFRSDNIEVEKIRQNKNVEVHFRTEVKELLKDKDGSLDGIVTFNNENNDVIKFPEIKALFPYIGALPNISFISHFNVLTKSGFVKTNENMETIIPGLYAVGDVREKEIKQIVTATNDGAIAAKHALDSLT